MRTWIILLLILLLIGSSSAIDIAGAQKSIETASSQAKEFFSSTSKDNIIIITGSGISIEDKVLFNMLKSQSSSIEGIEIEPDTYSFPQNELEQKDLILLGGENTNLISRKYSSVLLAGNKTTVSPFVLVFSDSGRKIMMVYSEKETENNGNKAAERSPLSQFIDKKYVPAVASFFGILLLYIWGLLSKTIMGLFSNFSSSKIIERIVAKKKIRKKEAVHLKLHEYIDKIELLSLLMTSIIFAVTMSWTWMNELQDFKRMFILNLIIVIVISFIREIYRQYCFYKLKLRTEYVLWPFGALVTLLSTFLGNTFSLASYTLLDENADVKKEGRINFRISLLTFIFAAAAYAVNFFSPNIAFQMIFVYSIMFVFLELLPLAPMAGNSIRRWNFVAWALLYIVVFFSYIFVNFTVYI